MSGPGIRHDELVFGDKLLDITPTVLALFGLPTGEDMRGRVLAEAFESPVETGSGTSSWREPTFPPTASRRRSSSWRDWCGKERRLGTCRFAWRRHITKRGAWTIAAPFWIRFWRKTPIRRW